MASHEDSSPQLAHQDSPTDALMSGKIVDDSGGEELESSIAPPPPDATDSKCSQRPPLSPSRSDDSSQRPPLSPSSSSTRHQSTAINQMPEVSFEGSPKGNAWDSKKVAKDIEEVSKQDEKEHSKTPGANPKNRILTLSEISKTCPVEEEAEKLILKAIDEKKDRGVMGKSSILPHVPVNASAKAFEATPVASTSHDKSADSNIAPMETSLQANANSTRAPSLHVSVPSSHASSAQHTDTSTNANGTRRKWGRLGNLFSSPWKRHDQEGQELEVTSPSVSFATRNTQKGPGSNSDDLFRNANILFRRSTPDSSAGDIEQGLQDSSHDSDPSGKKKVKKTSVTLSHMAYDAKRNVNNELESFDAFLKPRKQKMRTTMKTELLYIIFPLLIVAAILYYGTGNPIHTASGASVSWIIIFAVRNIVVYMLGKATSIYVIEYLSLKRRFTVKLFGPFIALMIVQSAGYPSYLFFYGIWSLILLSGSGNFAKHWLFWQDIIDMCNASNPAGTITEQGLYPSTIGCMILFGAAVAAKRLWLGLYIAKRTFLNYDGTYTQVKDDISLVAEIARTVEDSAHSIDLAVTESLNCETLDGTDDASCTSSASGSMDHYQFNVLNSSQRAIIRDHLEAWEEPAATKTVQSDPSISDILQFRQRIAAVDDKYPFTTAFGLADTREHCFEAAQQLYYHLLLRQNGGKVLHFDSIAAVALNSDGTMDEDEMKHLVALFRPDRKGELSEIDFLKSIDSLYRDFRLLQASIDNSGSMDKAFEIMINYAFYIVLWCIMLSIVGIDPLALFVSLSGLIIGFSFMVGSAASKYFEGILFILFRRPYDVGDRISVSNVEHDTSPDGSTTWFVENLGLYSTTVRLALTNEVATYSNGSLASSRIINAKRSKKAIVAVYLKFDDETSYDKLRIFQKTVEKFVKERPREWISLQSFRPVDVEQDQGYVKYKVQLQHRESWQNLNSILNSKSEVTSFSLEVSKQLGMRYVAPPLPVDLHMKDNSTKATVPS